MAQRVLIVDDHAAVSFALAKYLAQHGFEVDTAAGQREAKALLVERQYALVVTDLHLAGVRSAEGVEVIRVVRERHPRTPVVLLSGFVTADIAAEAYRCGAALVLEKEGGLHSVMPRLLHLLERQRDTGNG